MIPNGALGASRDIPSCSPLPRLSLEVLAVQSRGKLGRREEATHA